MSVAAPSAAPIAESLTGRRLPRERILEMLDREPALARAYVVEGAHGGSMVIAHRAALMKRLALALDEGRAAHDPGTHCTDVTAEGLVGGVLAIVHSHLLRRDPRALA